MLCDSYMQSKCRQSTDYNCMNYEKRKKQFPAHYFLNARSHLTERFSSEMLSYCNVESKLVMISKGNKMMTSEKRK